MRANFGLRSEFSLPSSQHAYVTEQCNVLLYGFGTKAARGTTLAMWNVDEGISNRPTPDHKGESQERTLLPPEQEIPPPETLSSLLHTHVSRATEGVARATIHLEPLRPPRGTRGRSRRRSARRPTRPSTKRRPASSRALCPRRPTAGGRRRRPTATIAATTGDARRRTSDDGQRRRARLADDRQRRPMTDRPR